jgi:hypothetical protein
MKTETVQVFTSGAVRVESRRGIEQGRDAPDGSDAAAGGRIGTGQQAKHG